ncbi:hypothetical protein D3C71_1859790 [compost metagenome]
MMVAASAAVPRRRSTFSRASSSWNQRVIPAIWSRCGAFEAVVICPPMNSFFSNRVTSWPRSADTRAASIPAGPAPTTTTLRFTPVDFSMMCGTPMYSREVAAFWMHSTSRPWY